MGATAAKNNRPPTAVAPTPCQPTPTSTGTRRHACRGLAATRAGDHCIPRPPGTHRHDRPWPPIGAPRRPACPLWCNSDAGRPHRRKPPAHAGQPAHTRVAHGSPRPSSAAGRAPARRHERERRWARRPPRRPQRQAASGYTYDSDRRVVMTAPPPSRPGSNCMAAAGRGSATGGATRLFAKTAPPACTRPRGDRHKAQHHKQRRGPFTSTRAP